MKTIHGCCFAVLSFTLLIAPARAQDDLPLVKPEVKTLAAFKNGLGFVFKSGDVQTSNGWARLDQLPSAALGSLWIGTTSKAGPVTDVISYKQKITESAEAVTMAELLAANVGRRVAITYSLGNSPTRVEGTLISVPPDRKPDESPTAPVLTAAFAARSVSERAPGEIVLIRAGTATQPVITSVRKQLIQTLELLDGHEPKTKIEKEVERVKLRVGGNPKSAEITMGYLEKGIVWSPSYRINITNDKTAEVALDAVLANDVEDLENVEVSFVVGNPNFMYADVLTPLSLRQSVASFIQALMNEPGSARTSPFGNVMRQSIAYNSANFDPGTRPDAQYSVSQMAGEASEDLYFYKKPGVTLKKGDRARYEVFTASVPYEHIYKWDVADTMSVDDRGYRQSSGNRREPENLVWHMLRLENKTKQPWTTAPAFTMNGSMPVAQDVLGYAPPGGKSTLKLTVASDLRAEAFQTEAARRSLNIEGNTYDEITVAGKLKVTSWKPGETCIVIHKSLTGEVLEAAKGKITKVARGLAAVNPSSEIEWEFHLAAGKEEELNYQYKVLIRR